MKSVITALKEKEAFISLTGASPEDIEAAETELNVKFASDYREYVTALGAASYYGHELTGVCKSKSLDVVKATISEREFNEVPADWYVLEQTHMDGIVFWQAGDGKVFQTGIKQKPIKVCDSLLEYIGLE
jgi:hypothetical protein